MTSVDQMSASPPGTHCATRTT